jgi:hypothetical protein
MREATHSSNYQENDDERSEGEWRAKKKKAGKTMTKALGTKEIV